MTPQQIEQQLARVGFATVALNNITALAQAAQLASAQLPVKWFFDPGTPASIVDHLAGTVEGAAKGAFVGVGAGLLLAIVFPPAIIGYFAAGGALIGAARGAQRVEQGWRVRLVYTSAGIPLLHVQTT